MSDADTKHISGWLREANRHLNGALAALKDLEAGVDFSNKAWLPAVTRKHSSEIEDIKLSISGLIAILDASLEPAATPATLTADDARAALSRGDLETVDKFLTGCRR